MATNPGRAMRLYRHAEGARRRRADQYIGEWVARERRQVREGRRSPAFERSFYAVQRGKKINRRMGNPSMLGVSVPRRILGVDARLVGLGALVVGFIGWQRRMVGATWPGWTGNRAHMGAYIDPQTGVVYTSSQPHTPPENAVGQGEWVAVDCADHGSQVCWAWRSLSTLSLAGVPAAS